MTEIERLESQIKRYKTIVQKLSDENALIAKEKEEMRKFFNTYPSKTWYIAYLQNSIFQLEDQYNNLQDNLHATLEENRRLKEATSYVIHSV